MSRWRIVAPATLATLLACGDVTAPSRADTYPFAIDCGMQGLCAPAAGNLRLIFRWPREALPVRIWVAPGSGLGPATANAIRVWEDVLLYGEFRAGFTSDSASADIIVRLGDPVAFTGGDNGDGNGTEPPLDCLGTTTLGVAAQDTSIILPFLTTISPRSGQGALDLQSCFEAVVAHELGHSLGLFLDSDNDADLMHDRPRRAEPSGRDRATFTLLYHTPPTVHVPPGR